MAQHGRLRLHPKTKELWFTDNGRDELGDDTPGDELNRFYEGKMFPAEYRDQVLSAEHGSWNRSDPIGYRLMRVRLDAQDKPVWSEVCVDGWLQHGKAWGRPVDLLVMPDGAPLVSDDEADVIYRITYTG